MLRPRAHVRKAEFLEKRTDMALMVVNPKPLLDDPLEVNSAPPHNAINCQVWAGFDDLDQFHLLILRQPRRLTGGPMIEQAVRAVSIEPMHPIAERLPVHAAHPCSVGPAQSVQDRRQRQQPSALIGVFAP
ncbi:hypothetical protein WH91_20425 [Devosia psychrophila]|uniref:Uncharacterized protein n=1 Tax=Devosia psychrophila TaxID=728005 RepID=A0ABR5DTC7_9HYPH|nr:hypothetical protein WH91_20425 [Devosia psychrophila]